MSKKIIIIITIGVILLGVASGAAGWWYYQNYKAQYVPETHWVFVTNPAEPGYPGAYLLKEGMTRKQVERTFQLRQQTPVRITFSGCRTLQDWAGRLGSFKTKAGVPLMNCDSLSLLKAIHDPAFLTKTGLDSANVISILLPDTYEVYWTITPEELLQRLQSEYNKYWNTDRTTACTNLHLTQREMSVLASIAEEETANRHERGIVGRLYWNRLQKGMLLQADPTVKFALGDPTIRRVLLSHLEVESPYNTYKHPGLPPGPLRMVDKATIDSILLSRPHDYIYMCAKPELNGLHNFAKSLTDHNRNADAYRRAISKLKL